MTYDRPPVAPCQHHNVRTPRCHHQTCPLRTHCMMPALVMAALRHLRRQNTWLPLSHCACQHRIRCIQLMSPDQHRRSLQHTQCTKLHRCQRRCQQDMVCTPSTGHCPDLPSHRHTTDSSWIQPQCGSLMGTKHHHDRKALQDLGRHRDSQTGSGCKR